MNSMKKGASMGAIIGVAFAFMTTFFGGGWATGTQTGAYATQHGWTAIFMPVIGVFLICCVGWIIVEFARLYNVWNYGDFMERFYGTKITKLIFDVIQMISMPISFSVCTATFGTTMAEYCGGSVLMWTIVFAVLVLISVVWGTAIVNKLATFMGTAILILLFVIFIAVTSNGGGHVVGGMVKEKVMYTSYKEALWWGGIKFCMLTSGLALSILPSYDALQTRKDVTKACLWGFLFCGLFIVIVCYNVMTGMPDAIKASIPMLAVIEKFNVQWLKPIYVIVVDLAVLTTANAMCNGYGRRFINFKFLSGWKSNDRTKMIVVSLIILIVGSTIGMLGLNWIFYTAYNWVAFMNTPLVALGIPVIGIAKLIQIKRRNMGIERGALEKEKSWVMFKKQAD